MASQAWLESSLRRSASLGLEVLERASRRSVDWTSTGASQTPVTTEEDIHIPVKVQKTLTELDNVFGTIADFMVQTTYQCKKYYESGCCSEFTDTERSHMSRFHTRPAAGMTTPSSRKHARTPYDKGRVSTSGEDFFIEVSPGTYAVTASMQDSQRQTQMVSIRAGESVNLTFNL